ncbi:MAG: hypothetical protein LM522_14830 [Candidatus Contendobacter sp.]|nr:hypothetical protein [Candidatus Contendobacter sp.]
MLEDKTLKNASLMILKKLEENGEMTLEEISLIIPKIHGDHRDFYIFSSLVSNGYLDDETLINNENIDANRHKDQLLARKYYACSTAERTAKFGNMTWSIHGGDNSSLKGQKFALSGKGSLYLSELRAKRFDRVFTLASGITVGILVALIGAYFRSKFGA